VFGVALVAVAVIVVPTIGGAGAASTSDWLVYHGNFLGSGVAAGTPPSHGAQASWTSPALQGQIYGEPLVMGTDVIVATENDVVYNLNAANKGHVRWSTHVGTPVTAGRLPCGDIRPRVGITSTPVIDSSRSEVFVVAEESQRGAISHHLVGLALSNGKVLLDERVDPSGSLPSAQLQRAGLTVANGQVIIGMGGNDGDCSTYHGWVVAVPESGGASLTFESDPTSGNSQGAVWMGGGAPIVDGSGNIWVTTGNGSNTSGASPDYSDSVVELSPTLQPIQWFAPTTWGSDNLSDADLGSSPPALLASGRVVQVGKSQTAYLLDQTSLGGIGGQQAELASVCSSFGGDAFNGQVVYVPCSGGVAALSVNSSPPSVTIQWRSSSSSAGPPIVAGGLLWTISRGGVLFGLDPQSGSPVAQLHIGAVANHFPTPSFGDGLLLAPSANRVHAFTLVP
jgi:hypothetical protein